MLNQRPVEKFGGPGFRPTQPLRHQVHGELLDMRNLRETTAQERNVKWTPESGQL